MEKNFVKCPQCSCEFDPSFKNETPPAMTEYDELCVDGWTSGNPGKGGAFVTEMSGLRLYSPVCGDEIHTNNFYELLGIAQAVAGVSEGKYKVKKIWSDSDTVIAWVEKGPSTKDMSERMKVDYDFIMRRLTLLRGRMKLHNIELAKWDTKTRGQIPADPGRKK